MKKIFYFGLFLATGFVCLYDSFTVLNKISFPYTVGLAIISMSIGILFILLWMEFKEVALASGIFLWIIPIANTFEMSKEGISVEEIIFFILSRIAIGIVFYFSVYESVSLAKNEFQKNKR